MEVAERTLAKIEQQVKSNPVIIYMKGTPQFPQCGFSSRAAGALASTGLPFAYFNILTTPYVYEFLPRYAQWPTFPQVYIGGELVGGCDITLELLERGELKGLMEAAINAAAAQSAEG